MGEYDSKQMKMLALTGSQCWVSVDFEAERLWLHYLWIFIVEFGTIAIYAHVFFYLRKSIRNIMHNDTSKLSRATRFMVLYPAAYVILTFPIALGRMITMAGVDMPDIFFCIAGAFLASCGWIDAVLYTLTRRVFIGGDISSHHYNRTVTAISMNASRPGDDTHFGLQSMNKEVGTARTVTIVGGSNRMSRIVDHSRGRKGARGRGLEDTLRETSPTGSQDSIMKPGPNVIGITTETNIQVESASESSSPIIPGRLVSRNPSQSGFSTHSR